MSQLIQQGDIFSFAPSAESMLDELPVGNYSLVKTMDGWVFKREVPFPELKNLYGNHEKLAARIYNSFSDRKNNTGVLLAGAKGSGKSLLGRLISLTGYREGVPTLLVPEAIDGESLRKILSRLDQSIIVFIDEFEKTYPHTEVQQSLLSLLDGLSTTKHLFLLTVNDVSRVDEHMRNRPGRLYYFLEFHGLDDDFIEQYGRDKLQDSSQLPGLIEISKFFREFNFDMLSSLVEEMNRYGETAHEAVKMLNISPEDQLREYFKVTVTDSTGKVVENDGHWHGNPLKLKRISYTCYPEDESEGKTLVLTKEKLVSSEVRRGIFTYRSEGYTVTLDSDLNNENKDHWATKD